LAVAIVKLHCPKFAFASARIDSKEVENRMSTATQHPTEKNGSVEWNEYASKDATIQGLTAPPLPRDTPKSVVIRIKRRANPNAPQYWETFKIPYRPNLNIISCLMEIRRNPVNAEGQQSTPVVWEMNCLEQVCGICTMIINGTVRQSCSALVDKLDQPIVCLLMALSSQASFSQCASPPSTSGGILNFSN
jgi:2Fe-2S iron-sulfur cluster binding domain